MMDEMDIDEMDDSNTSNDVESWVRWYQKQIQFNPRSTMARYKLGQLLARIGRYQEAISQWKAVIAIDANHLAARQAIQEVLSRVEIKTDVSHQGAG